MKMSAAVSVGLLFLNRVYHPLKRASRVCEIWNKATFALHQVFGSGFRLTNRGGYALLAGTSGTNGGNAVNRTANLDLQTAQDTLTFRVRGERFAVYHAAPEISGFAALFAPGLRAITRAMRSDGLALWLGHGDVNGIAFSTEPPQNAAETETEESRLPDDLKAFRQQFENEIGRIVTRETLARRGSQSIGFRQSCGWLAPDGRELLTDVRTVRIMPGPSAGRILDFTLELHAPADAAVRFGPSQESLLQMQVASAFLPDGGGQIRSSTGDYGTIELHGRRAAWLAGVGVIAGQTVGFAWLDHPENRDHPPPWIVRETGILAPSPFGWQTVELAPGEIFSARYRLLVHEGYVEQGWADARMRDWMRES